MSKQYVFGYGSLICPDSRKKTNPNLARKTALPVVVHHVERIWSARTRAMTAMDLQFSKDSECTGVLLEVTEPELEDLDRREACYDRVPVPLSNIRKVEFLDDDEWYEDDHPVFEETLNDKQDAVKVWMYMHQHPQRADASHPISQSYVDIILRGCLRISKDFADSFIETTEGWHSQEDHWVEDRDNPLYVRADPDYSRRFANTIDRVFKESLQNRVPYDPKIHLEALTDTDAPPRAIEFVESKITQEKKRKGR